MLAILSTLVFAGAGLAALTVIYASVRQHWAQAISTVRAAGKVAEVREFAVRFSTPTEQLPAFAAQQLRRQPRRSAMRPALRQADGQRVAA